MLPIRSYLPLQPCPFHRRHCPYHLLHSLIGTQTRSRSHQTLFHTLNSHASLDLLSSKSELADVEATGLSYFSPNHYSKWKRLVVSKFLCGKLWVRFPTKIKTTKHITHKNWTTTKDIYGIPDGKSLL